MAKQKFLLILVLLALSFSFVSAQPPQTSENGLQLSFPPFEYGKVSTAFEMPFHVYRISDGMAMTSDVNCTLHIYDMFGIHLFIESNTSPTRTFDYEFIINNSVFSSVGYYSLNVYCECDSCSLTNTDLGGFVEHEFIITETGESVSTANSLMYGVLILLFAILFASCLIWAFNVDGENKFVMGDKDEPIVDLNYGKYLKLFLYLLSYLFFWITSWFMWKISTIVLFGTNLFDVLKTIFIVETILWIPIIFIVVVVGFSKILADSELMRLSKRGLPPR